MGTLAHDKFMHSYLLQRECIPARVSARTGEGRNVFLSEDLRLF